MSWFKRLFMQWGPSGVGRVHFDGALFKDPRIGLRFCKVEMRDCMASTRGKEKWGTIVGVGETEPNEHFITDQRVKRVRNLSRLNRQNSWLNVRYDDGTMMWEPWAWCLSRVNDQGGYLEYQI